MKSRASGHGDLSPAEAERVVAAIKVIKTQNDDSTSAAARALGTSQPAVSNILTGRNGPGISLARTVAEHIRVPFDVLLIVDPDDEVPERARAVARLRYLLPDAVVKMVLAANRAADVTARWTEAQWVKFAIGRLEDYEMTQSVRAAPSSRQDVRKDTKRR